jgi:predicted ATPase
MHFGFVHQRVISYHGSSIRGRLLIASRQFIAQAAAINVAQIFSLGGFRVSALSVARLRLSQGRRREARAPLASVYDRFTEGFTTADLQAARTMLEGLPP